MEVVAIDFEGFGDDGFGALQIAVLASGVGLAKIALDEFALAFFLANGFEQFRQFRVGGVDAAGFLQIANGFVIAFVCRSFFGLLAQLANLFGTLPQS